MQADSDFGFLNEIADRIRLTTGGSTVGRWSSSRQRPTATAVALTVGDDLDSFSVRASALHPGTATICGWWPKTKQSVSADRRELDQRRPTADLVGPYLAATNLKQSNKTISTADMPGDQKEAETLADRLVERWTAGAVTAKGILPGGPADRARAARSRSPTPGRRPAPTTSPRSSTPTPRAVSKPVSPQAIDDRPAWSTCSPASRPSSFRRDGLVIGIVTMVGNSAGLRRRREGQVRLDRRPGGEQLGQGRHPGRRLAARHDVHPGDQRRGDRRVRGRRRPAAGDSRAAVYNGKDVPVEFGVQNNTVSQRRITSRLGHFVEFGDGTEHGQPAHRPQPGRRRTPGAAGQGQARRASVPAGIPITDHVPATPSIEIGQDGSITLTGKKITLKSEDRCRDLRRQHHREGQRQGGHLRDHDGGQGLAPPARSRPAAL